MAIVRILTLSTTHSEHHGKNLFIALQGDNPVFGYIWIDDIQYEIIKGKRTVSLKKVKL